MIRRSTEPQSSTGKRATKTSNGATNEAIDGVFTTNDMELDQQMNDVEDTSSDAMDMEESDYATKCQDMLSESLVYGRELRADYAGDERKEYRKTLNDIFSLVAYADPKSSVHGHLLDPSGRVPVAEELNSAILGGYFPCVSSYSLGTRLVRTIE